MNINGTRKNLNNFLKSISEISISNRVNLSQLQLNEMHCLSYSASEHETDLCHEAKQMQFALQFHHII